MVRHTDNPTRIRLLHSLLYGLEQCCVGFWIIERHSRRINGGNTPLWKEKTNLSGTEVEAFANPSAHGGIFLDRSAHKRYILVVNVEVTLAVFFGDRGHGCKIDHIQRADAADVRNTGTDDCAKAIVSRAHHAAHK